MFVAPNLSQHEELSIFVMFANLIDNILTVVLICIHLLMRLISVHVFKGHASFFFSDLPVYAPFVIFFSFFLFAPFVIFYYANLHTVRILTISLFFWVCNFLKYSLCLLQCSLLCSIYRFFLPFKVCTCVHTQLLSHVWFFVTPWTIAL